MKFNLITIFLSLLQFSIVICCVYLINFPIFYWHNFIIFLVGAVSTYLYIIAITNVKNTRV